MVFVLKNVLLIAAGAEMSTENQFKRCSLVEKVDVDARVLAKPHRALFYKEDCAKV